MKRKNLFISMIALAGALLASCSGRQSVKCQWSKWYDNGDGTHSRHCIDDITKQETDHHHFKLTKTIIEPTEVAPGRASFTCEECSAKEEQILPPTGNYVFDQKVVDEKYLYERCSEHSAIYYMSSVEGAYGNPEKLFEYSDIEEGYSEVEYVKSDGRQYIDTGAENISDNKVILNNSSIVLPEEYQDFTVRLPNEYQEVTYLKSSGTQYIDLGLTIDKLDSCGHIIDIQFLDNQARWCGVNWLLQYCYNDGRYIKDHNRHLFVQNYEDFIATTEVDGVQRSAVDMSAHATKNIKYCIFRMGDKEDSYYVTDSDISKPSSQILYSLKVFKNNQLFRDVVPCYKKDTKEAGVYDLITNHFFANDGEGEFEVGSDINRPVSSIRDDISAAKQDIPSYFYQLNYIESYGYQEIDTKVTGPATLETSINFMPNGRTQKMGYGSEEGEYFGVDSSNKYLGTSKLCEGLDSVVVDFGDSEEGIGKLKINGEDQANFVVGDLSEKTLSLFNAGENNGCSALIFGAKVKQNGVLVRDFVPVMYRETREAGLYDLVTKQFYTNGTKFAIKSGGLMYEGINAQNINMFCNRTSNMYAPTILEINSYKILSKDNTVLRDLVPVVKNSDGKAGFYDVKGKQFYTSSSEFELEAGPIVMHKLDEGTVSSKPTYNQQGEMVYKCSICGAEIHKHIERTAFKVTFIPDSSEMTAVKIFQTNDPNKYQMSLVGYTRNRNTYNYSKYNASIEFEIPSDGEVEYEIVCSNGKAEQLDNGHYLITGITADTYVNIRIK